MSKAISLAARVQQAFPGVDVHAADTDVAAFDLVVNATSLGMGPDDQLPVSESAVERSRLIADCVISPEMTRLLTLAQKKGRRIQTGVPMLAAQMDLMLRFMGVEEG
jgi:shikimate dehydrogenase